MYVIITRYYARAKLLSTSSLPDTIRGQNSFLRHHFPILGAGSFVHILLTISVSTILRGDSNAASSGGGKNQIRLLGKIKRKTGSHRALEFCLFLFAQFRSLP